MSVLDNNYLGKHKKFRADSRKLATAFLVLAFVVSIIVFWWLKLVGITVTGEALCGLSEHTHSDECYINELVCELQEISSEAVTVKKEPSASDKASEADNASSDEASVNEIILSDEASTEDASYKVASDDEISEAHSHSVECYTKILSCTVPEHMHSGECFPDKTADTETVSDWLSTIDQVEITNNIPENLIDIALSQVGYEESHKNFEYDGEGNKNGYTRYGEWYGNPYGKWNAMFVSFCLHYSNINNAAELKSAGAETMRLAWQNRSIYSPSDKYVPQRGDIVFYDSNNDGTADRVGIILSVDKSALVIVSGDSDNKVVTENIEISDNIIGYGLTGMLSFAKDTEADDDITKEHESETEDTVSPEGVIDAEEPLLMMSSSQKANIIYVTDLSSVIVDVTFKTEDNIEIDNGSTIYIGQTYVISLEFSEINTGDQWVQFSHNDDHFLTYQIPENLHCEPFTSWHPISAKTENGTIEDVGEYFVDDHGFLRVRFFDGEDGLCFGQRYSNVDFTIEFNATVDSTQSGENTEVIFNDEIKVNLNVDGGAGMTVNKTHGSYDSDTHTMEYTIRVEATKGLVKDLVIADQIWENHYTLRDTIVVTDLDGNVLDPQPTVSDHPQHNSGAEEGFSISDFPDFSAGNGFLITYKTQIYDYLLGNETVDMWNGLDSTGKDSNGNDVYVWSDDWLRVELEKMEKAGSQSVLEDANGNPVPVIEWEVEIKKNNHNLQGTVIIDTLGDGLEYYTDKEIRIKRYDEWGNRLSDVYVSWDDVTVNGNTMSFALPDGYSFDIVYYTEYEELAEGEKKHYTNSVSATLNGKEETAGGEADVVGFIPDVRKSASGDDGEYVYFTIEADVPAVIKDWGNFYLTDLAAFWGYNNDAGYLYVENMPQDMVITAVTDSGNTVNFTPYVPGGATENTYILVFPSDGDLHHSFNVFFNTSDADFNSSKWILDENSRLIITYKLPFDAKTGTDWEGELSGDKTLGDVLLEGYKVSNEAYLNYTDVIRGTGTTTYEYAPVITKDAVVNENGTIDYTVVFHNTIPGSHGDLGYLNATIDDVCFNDTFDEKLEYVAGSLKVTCYDPWRDGLWMNKYTYNGQVTGNSMNIPANQFLYVESNPDATAVGWSNLYKRTDLEQFYKWVNAGGDYVFTYTLKLKDEYLNTTDYNEFSLDNTAELTWGEDGSSGPVTENAEYNTGLIDKHVVQENNKLNFDIHINRNALDILEGAKTLIIEDTMTHNLSVYWESIKLYYEDDNGNWIDFDAENDSYSYTVTYDQDSNKLTFVVPDELHIRIDYTTLITESGLVSVNNAVKIDGKAEVADIIDAIFKVDEHSGGASGSLHNITLLKQDGDTDKLLPNVRFLLYGPMGDPDAVIPDSVQESIVAPNNKNLHYIGSYTTGADGTVSIETQYLTLGGPYALVEDLPPVGYQKLDAPVYFYFYSPDPDGIIQTVTTLIAVENYTYGFVLPETGGSGTQIFTIIGFVLMTAPILYSIIRRKRERRFL